MSLFEILKLNAKELVLFIYLFIPINYRQKDCLDIGIRRVPGTFVLCATACGFSDAPRAVAYAALCRAKASQYTLSSPVKSVSPFQEDC